MGFTKKTPDNAFSNFLNETKQVVFNRALKAFVYVGEACLREARLNGNYTDQTGNLRNSIGYAVLFNGEVIQESIYANTEGGHKGKKHLDALKKKYQTGIVLIVSTGMNYAAYVEARNYNVITSAELLANKLVPQIMKQLGFKLQ